VDIIAAETKKLVDGRQLEMIPGATERIRVAKAAVED